MAILIDTSVIADLERARQPLNPLRAAFGPDARLYVSSVVVAELLLGVELAESEVEALDSSANTCHGLLDDIAPRGAAFVAQALYSLWSELRLHQVLRHGYLRSHGAQ
jgi:hypothetical protein